MFGLFGEKYSISKTAISLLQEQHKRKAAAAIQRRRLKDDQFVAIVATLDSHDRVIDIKVSKAIDSQRKASGQRLAHLYYSVREVCSLLN